MVFIMVRPGIYVAHVAQCNHCSKHISRGETGNQEAEQWGHDSPPPAPAQGPLHGLQGVRGAGQEG